MWAGEYPVSGKKHAVVWTPALAAAVSTLICGAARAADEPAPPRFLLTPIVGVQETYTDNAELSSSGHSSDFITRAMAGLDLLVNSGPLSATVRGKFAYDWYAKQSQLNGKSISADGAGAYALVKDRLWIEAQGTITNGFTSNFGSSAVDRSGVFGRTQLGIYNIGPHFKSHIGDFADLEGAARWEQVFYSKAESSQVPNLPSRDDIAQFVTRIDTADRFQYYQLLTTAQYQRDKQGYRSGNVVQSAFVNILPNLRLIARGGYERVFQTNVTDIHAPVLSAGLEFRINRLSRISIEGGERYKRPAWAAKAEIQLMDRYFLVGRYTETLAPDQLYVADSFEQFVAETATLPQPIVPPSFAFRENLYNQTSFNKMADLHGIWRGDFQSLDLSVRWSDRRFLVSNTHDRSVLSYASYTRQLRPDLDLIADGNYSRTLASPLYGKSWTYTVRGRLQYKINTTTLVNASYARTHGKQTFLGGAEIIENTIMISVEKRFE